MAFAKEVRKKEITRGADFQLVLTHHHSLFEYFPPSSLLAHLNILGWLVPAPSIYPSRHCLSPLTVKPTDQPNVIFETTFYSVFVII